MTMALREAEKAFREGEVPVGAVLVAGGEVVASAHNTREASSDPTAHAEILVMRAASRSLARWRLTDAAIYVTKEPCIMCAGAMVNARLGRLVYGCGDLKAGGVQGVYQILTDKRLNHQVEVVSGILEEECSALLKVFFQKRRRAGRESP